MNMEAESAQALMSSDVTITLIVCGVSFLAVMVPLYRGLAIALQALAATRKVTSAELMESLKNEMPRSNPPITLQMVHILKKALRESERESNPKEFLIDASRQYISNDYDAHYARPMSMCANILPPLGFIGTTGGLFVLFLSMGSGNDSLELAALASALTSSIFALIGFSGLEGFKFGLYRRLLARLDEAVSFSLDAKMPDPEPYAPLLHTPAQPSPNHG